MAQQSSSVLSISWAITQGIFPLSGMAEITQAGHLSCPEFSLVPGRWNSRLTMNILP